MKQRVEPAPSTWVGVTQAGAGLARKPAGRVDLPGGRQSLKACHQQPDQPVLIERPAGSWCGLGAAWNAGFAHQ